ncbi:hypothetical protein GYMLUDRAFT_237049 [Collybiopsis luxurians FD-317 M1]|nr:hypothetical protein GYMLUDRAFT_237049 [Collybiopsis luxurians FD-317 M1]
MSDSKPNSNDNDNDIPDSEKKDSNDAGQNAKNDEFEVHYASGSRLAVITLGVCLAFLVVFLDSTVVSTVAPHLTTVFDSLRDVGWYGSAYMIVMASLQPTFGKLYTVFDLKIIYLAALVIFEVGSVICASATSSLMFILGRAVAGLGGSALASGTVSIIAYSVPLEKQPAFIGGVSTMFSIAAIVGPLMGGAFTDTVSWRWSFYINLPIGAITFFTIAAFFTSPKRKSGLTLKKKIGNLDFLGASLFIGGTICLLLALQWGGAVYPWRNSKIWGLFLGVALILPIFVLVQIKRGDRATIPPSVASKRNVLVSVLYLLFYNMAYYVHEYYLPMYFQAVKNTSAVTSGLRLIPYLISNTAVALLAGIYVNRTGNYYFPLWAGAVLYIIGSGLLSTLDFNSSTAKWLGYEILAGIGRGSGQLPYVTVQVGLNPEQVPIATSLIMLCASLGGAVALGISQSIFNAALAKEVVRYAPSIDPNIVLNAGATAFRSIVPADALDGVVEAYAKAIRTVLIVPIAYAGVSLLISFAIERSNLKSKRQNQVEKAATETDVSNRTSSIKV